MHSRKNNVLDEVIARKIGLCHCILLQESEPKESLVTYRAAIMVPTISYDNTKAATNITVDFSFYSLKLPKSYWKMQLFSKICILIQDTVTSNERILLQDTIIDFSFQVLSSRY